MLLRVALDDNARCAYATKGSAGLDLSTVDSLVIKRQTVVYASTGVRVEIPSEYFGLLSIRSSLIKQGLMMANGVGVIDSDYRGLIYVPLINMSNSDVRLTAGERIAQLILIPTVRASLLYTDTLEATDRGTGGFGSTGRF